MTWSPTQSGVLQPTNSTLFPNADTNGVNGITIPFGDLESYETASSGDIRELVYSVLDKVEDHFTNSVSEENRPSKFTITKNYSSTGENSAKKVFVVTFLLDAANVVYDVTEE